VVTDATRVAIDLAPFLKKEKKLQLDTKNGTIEDHSTHTELLWQT
jgi:hypothetical protein